MAVCFPQCSAMCGGGIKTRTIQCQQVRAQGRSEERPTDECPDSRPRTVRKCNQRACREGQGSRKKPVIKSQNYQNFVQSNLSNKLTLKVRFETASETVIRMFFFCLFVCLLVLFVCLEGTNVG